LELQSDAVSFADIKEFDEFSTDAIDALNILLRACPHLDAVNL
jgi:hypothetical protein